MQSLFLRLEYLIVLAVLHICPLHAAVGSTPVISLDEDTRYGFKVSCVSRGWYPKPELQWTDGRGAVLTAETSEEQDGQGLYTVRSYLRTPEPEGGQVSCVIKYGKDQGELRSSTKIIDNKEVESKTGFYTVEKKPADAEKPLRNTDIQHPPLQGFHDDNHPLQQFSTIQFLLLKSIFECCCILVSVSISSKGK
ncbi:CD276 antigen-like [Acipenser ruthenus]|uniref:CD276 antigen-like n=1 Tax=Acipenser ruthenus TaxID=7906 RepID=UPI002741D388|nr:CD276 antigen-like [Acipenser ruthenus]XP_058859270.1 CD276 antigen-like [Acipenser ruthenus]